MNITTRLMHFLKQRGNSDAYHEAIGILNKNKLDIDFHIIEETGDDILDLIYDWRVSNMAGMLAYFAAWALHEQSKAKNKEIAELKKEKEELQSLLEMIDKMKQGG